ncbi:hypothetical protein [Moorena producens]|uniref:hypothetical protein n=1 Tax=Moorena producens TaxID=1155739 RepID=UPI001314B2EC|nr:hypothetical protein [Moorena producens]
MAKRPRVRVQPSTLQPFNPSTFNPSILQPFNPSTLAFGHGCAFNLSEFVRSLP